MDALAVAGVDPELPGPPCASISAGNAVERHQPAVIDDRDPVAEALRFFHVVGR